MNCEVFYLKELVSPTSCRQFEPSEAIFVNPSNLGLWVAEQNVFGAQEVEHYQIREVLRCTIILLA